MKNMNALSIKKAITMGITLVIVTMLVIPFSGLALEVLFGIEAVFAVSIVIYSFLKHRKAMSVLILTFAMFSLAVNISYTRVALLGYESGNQVPVVCFFSDMLGGKNISIGFLIAIILMSVQVIIVTKSAGRVGEIKKQKKAAQDEVEWYSRLDGATKFLKGSMKATIVIIMVNIFGGIAMGFKLDLPFSESLEAMARITTGNMVVFLLPTLVTSFALEIVVARDKKFIELK